MILLRNGSVLTTSGLEDVDVAISGDRVVGVGRNVDLPGAQAIDISGCALGPGLVDLHVHLREPGQTWKEDIESGSLAAAAGGFTALVAMPNTEPPIDSLKVLREVLARAKDVGLVEVAAAATLTKDRAGAVLSDIDALYQAGVRVFTDDGDSLANPSLLETAMLKIAKLPGAVVSQHAEDATRTTGGHMHEGVVSRKLGVRGLPAEAESDVVARDIELVRRTGARYHCQHLSTSNAVEHVRRAKKDGLPVTSEVTPHHLIFDETTVGSLDTNFKMYPPLREKHDVDSLREALRDGTIDIVATDHAPHSHDEKAVGFEEAPRGVIGLETAAAATWEVLQEPRRFFEVMSLRPAEIGQFPTQGRPVAEGGPANLVVFDPDAEWRPSVFKSKSQNSPFLARQMKGRIRHTISNGRLIYTSEGSS